ncbi:MAG TPA: hypothetical protein VFJ82_12955 [Longimicrobium sp.]|nr:hypothetical protein [Longimicrobium sp.]
MDEKKKPGPPEPRVKVPGSWEDAAAKMIRTPPLPKVERERVTRPRRRGGGVGLGSSGM